VLKDETDSRFKYYHPNARCLARNRMNLRNTSTLLLFVSIVSISCARTPDEAKSASGHQSKTTPKIAWYGQLKDGLAEAKRSQRPILLVSAAPQCQNVSGMW